MDRLIYMDSEHHLMDYDEVLNYLIEWRIALLVQGFNNNQIIQIIFDKPHFKTNFLEENIYWKMKSRFIVELENLKIE